MGLIKFLDTKTIYLILLAVVEIYGDFAFEKYANIGGSQNLIRGFFGYIGVMFFLVKSLQGTTILYVNNMWDGISSIVETLAAFLILGERFERPTQYIAVLLIVSGMYLLHN